MESFKVEHARAASVIDTVAARPCVKFFARTTLVVFLTERLRRNRENPRTDFLFLMGFCVERARNRYVPPNDPEVTEFRDFRIEISRKLRTNVENPRVAFLFVMNFRVD